jgi:hypothetical protein
MTSAGPKKPAIILYNRDGYCPGRKLFFHGLKFK